LTVIFLVARVLFLGTNLRLNCARCGTPFSAGAAFEGTRGGSSAAGIIGVSEESRAAHRRAKLGHREADCSKIEVERFQLAKLELQQAFIPAGVQRELVVRDHLGALLRVRPAARDNAGHIYQPKLLGRQHEGYLRVRASAA
jgi:hypothetical protein